MANATTSPLHQLRDQGLHLAIGAIGTLPVAFFAPWWAALLVAALWAGLREGEQWPKLNSPSLWDSALDWSVVLLGSQAAWWAVWGLSLRP